MALATRLEISMPRLRHSPSRQLIRSAFTAAGVIAAVAAVALTTERYTGRLADVLVSVAASAVSAAVAGVTAVLMTSTWRAFRLADDAAPTLVLDEAGLRIPVLMLTEPAFGNAVNQGIRELLIPWADVLLWTEEPAMHDAPPHIRLWVRGDAARLGLVPCAPLTTAPRIGIVRPERADDDRALVAFLACHAPNPDEDALIDARDPISSPVLLATGPRVA